MNIAAPPRIVCNGREGSKLKNDYWMRLIVSAGAIALVLAVPLMSVFWQSGDNTEVMSGNAESGYTLILDAGHGGEDGGAVSVTGTHESAINLAIAERCEQLAAFMGVEPVMTRDSEELRYPPEATTTRARKVYDQKRRAALINDTPNAILISIHQNKYTSSGPKGAQAFYRDGGETLAAQLQELFYEYVNTDRKRTADSVADNIYLMKAIGCPAVLLECGFVSNPEEAAKLETDDYQKLFGVMIIGAYVSVYGR